ncbi:MAG: glycerophosphodiester phosphodiesterase [Thermoplasmatota archaeon]
MTLPRVLAHRGASRSHPENTLEAFRAAAALGCRAVEFDVQLSKDGVPVVIHDATVDRTTLGRGAVRDLSCADLSALAMRPAGAAEPAGSVDESRSDPLRRIPSLDAVLDWAAKENVFVDLEIKCDDDGRPYPGLAEKVARALKARRLTDGKRVLVTSFSGVIVDGILAEGLPAGWISVAPPAALAAAAEAPPGLELPTRLDEVAALVLWEGALDAETLEAPSWGSVPVLAWTVDDPDRAQSLLSAKAAMVGAGRAAAESVAGVITNDPETILRALPEPRRAA